MKWEQCPVTHFVSPEGRETQPGYICAAGLGVILHERKWWIVHLASGKFIRAYHTAYGARAVCELLFPLTDWWQPEYSLPPGLASAVRTALARP